MTASRTNSPVSKKAAPLVKFEDDPSLMRMGNDTDYEHPESPNPTRPHEFVVTTGANSIMFVSGLKITLDSVIEDENRTYDHCVQAFHQEMADGIRKPTDTLAEMIGGEETGLADLTIWGRGGRVAAVLVPRLDGSGYEVTRYSKDRSRPGPIPTVRKVVPMPTDVTLPVASKDGRCHAIGWEPKPGLWRLFSLCFDGKLEEVHFGHGLTPEDVVSNLAENLRDEDAPAKPGDHTIETYTIFEGGTLLATVRHLDGRGKIETTWVDLEEPLPPKSTAATVKPARAPWRSFKVDQPGGGFASIVEGYGKTLDDAIAEAVGEVHLMIDAELKPEDHVIVEQDRVVCRVLAADVLTEVGWLATCDAEDDAIAVPTAKDVVTADAPAPARFSPADLPELALSLARCELRDAIDALLGARSRCNEAHGGMGRLSGVAKRIVKEIDYRADNTCTDAEYAIARTLLSVFGITDGGVQPIDTTPPPWTPCGALVENRYFMWCIPGEHRGQAVYSIGEALVRVVDNEDLEEDGLSDDDWDTLLAKPPCRYVILHGSNPPVVVDPECHTWH